jgi:hypothetical protein
LRPTYLISLFFTFFIGFLGYAQTYNYTYTDPCTGNIKTIVVPINGQVTVGYYGYTNNFSASDFTDGTFEAWTTDIFALYGQDSPCSQIVGIGTVVTVTQNTTFTVLGILNSLTTIADVAASGTSNILGGSINSISGSSGENNNNNKNKNNGNNNVNNNPSNPSGTGGNISSSPNENQSTQQGSSQTSTETSSSPTSGTTEESSSTSTSVPTGEGSGETGSSGSPSENPVPGNSGGTSQGEENPQTTPEQTPPTKEGEGKTNITAGATTTARNAPSKNEGGKPSVVASSDFVGFNFRNSEVNYGAKATGGYTALRWDGQRSWGALADYTSALKGPNITGFYAWIKPKSVTLLSGTATIGFDGNKSLYGTIAGGQMFTFQKVPKLKVVYMGTISYGHIFREQFVGTAIIAGAMYDMKIGKRIDIKLMNLMVYAPYVSYYNDIVLASPYVMLPSIGTNIGITKRFKFNINGGGAWDLKTAALNYTVTCGTRLLIGQ